MSTTNAANLPADFASWRQLPPGIELSFSKLDSFLEWADQVSDPRVRHWPLMQSIVPTVVICLAYFAMAIFGKKIMANRQPFQLKNAMTVYNISVILLNSWLFINLIKHVVQQQYAPLCNPVDYGPEGEEVAWLIYIYYLTKILDFSDTVFMVLRKKWDQLTVLHVYHHGLMTLIWWSATKYAAGGNAVVGPIMNTFIHAVMYSYYFSSTFGIKIPGKRYLTQMQMTQLFILLQHSILSVFADCKYPHWTQYCQIIFMVTLLILFGNFYVQSYLKGKRSSASRSKAIAKANSGSVPPSKTVAHNSSLVAPVVHESASPISSPTGRSSPRSSSSRKKKE